MEVNHSNQPKCQELLVALKRVEAYISESLDQISKLSYHSGNASLKSKTERCEDIFSQQLNELKNMELVLRDKINSNCEERTADDFTEGKEMETIDGFLHRIESDFSARKDQLFDQLCNCGVIDFKEPTG